MILDFIKDISFFVIIPALISTVIYSVYGKKRIESGVILIYISFFLSFIVLIKCITGEGSITLLESFSENGKMTYVHYSVPLLILAVLIPVIIHFLAKRCDGLLDALYAVPVYVYCFSVIGFMFMGRCVNGIIGLGAIAGTIAFIISLIKHRQADAHMNLSAVKGSIKNNAIAVGFWAVSFFIFVPCKLYLTNISDFNIAYTYFFLTMVTAAVVFTALIALITAMIVPDNISGKFNNVVIVLTLMAYIQGNFLNGSMIQMDDRVQEWPLHDMIVNILVWLLGISVLLLVLRLISKKLPGAACMIAIYLSLIQLFTVGYLTVVTDKSQNTSILTTDDMFLLSSENNTIVFVLDWFDEQILEGIVRENGDFLKPVEDFVWYKNQTSRYAYTSLSVPYMLTGVRWNGKINNDEYIDMAYKESTLMRDIEQSGYKIKIYTDPYLVRNDHGCISNYSTEKGKCDFLKTIRVMAKCSRYQMSPFCIKNNFFYSSRKISELLKNGYVVGNRDFYLDMKNRGIELDKESRGMYIFYHLNGIHSLEINENIEEEENADIYSCGRGTLKIVFEFIDEMKKKGVYENSTIIITADHGQNYLDEPELLSKRRLENNTSNPILLIKWSGDDEKGRVSLAPVSHDDFAASVMYSIGGDYEKYGRTYSEFDEGEKRIREFEFYRDGDVPYQKYIIDGIATDINSWSKE